CVAGPLVGIAKADNALRRWGSTDARGNRRRITPEPTSRTACQRRGEGGPRVDESGPVEPVTTDRGRARLDPLVRKRNEPVLPAVSTAVRPPYAAIASTARIASQMTSQRRGQIGGVPEAGP